MPTNQAGVPQKAVCQLSGEGPQGLMSVGDVPKFVFHVFSCKRLNGFLNFQKISSMFVCFLIYFQLWMGESESILMSDA